MVRWRGGAVVVRADPRAKATEKSSAPAGTLTAPRSDLPGLFVGSGKQRVRPAGSNGTMSASFLLPRLQSVSARRRGSRDCLGAPMGGRISALGGESWIARAGLRASHTVVRG